MCLKIIEHDDSDDSQAAFLVPPLKSCWSPLAVVCSGGEGAVGDTPRWMQMD
jgi:hypothetical protein